MARTGLIVSGGGRVKNNQRHTERPALRYDAGGRLKVENNKQAILERLQAIEAMDRRGKKQAEEERVFLQELYDRT